MRNIGANQMKENILVLGTSAKSSNIQGNINQERTPIHTVVSLNQKITINGSSVLHYIERISPVQRHRHHLSGVQLICQLYFIKRHDLLQFNDHHIGVQYVNIISFTCQSQCCKHWCCKSSHHSPSWIYQ